VLLHIYETVSSRDRIRLDTAFEKVHFGLISMTEAYNGDEWALHFLDDATRMNFIFTFPAKSDTLQHVKDFYEMVVTLCDQRIKKFKYDRERTLGNE
jgi:hypothetical protein